MKVVLFIRPMLWSVDLLYDLLFEKTWDVKRKRVCEVVSEVKRTLVGGHAGLGHEKCKEVSKTSTHIDNPHFNTHKQI